MNSYISAENLFEILGGDFPREEIKAIIAEATGGKNEKISYAEFLKLWEEKKENDREQMIIELVKDEEDNVSVASLESTEARASFIGKKIASSAKVAKVESLGSDGSRGSLHVGFEDSVDVIPTNSAVV